MWKIIAEKHYKTVNGLKIMFYHFSESILRHDGERLLVK